MSDPFRTPRPSIDAPWSALLDVAGPGGHKTSLPFKPPRVLVGRKRSNDLSLPDQNVSSAHCEFVVESGWFVVRDLSSINGTFVNDRRIREARLRDGDVVRLGGTRITVALQGTLRGAQLWSMETARLHKRWLALAGVALLLIVGGLVYRQQSMAEEAKLRQAYAAMVRALLQSDPCATIGPHVNALVALDQRINGRPVPMAAAGEKLSPQMQQAGVELLGLYRAKSEESAKALQELSEEQQAEREAVEKVNRLAARLSTSQDRKITYFAQSQLAERLLRGDALLASFTELTRETQKFASLVEAVSLRGDQLKAPELMTFRFVAPTAVAQLAACKIDLARTNAGALGAINGLAEE